MLADHGILKENGCRSKNIKEKCLQITEHWGNYRRPENTGETACRSQNTAEQCLQIIEYSRKMLTNHKILKINA